MNQYISLFELAGYTFDEAGFTAYIKSTSDLTIEERLLALKVAEKLYN